VANYFNKANYVKNNMFGYTRIVTQNLKRKKLVLNDVTKLFFF